MPRLYWVGVLPLVLFQYHLAYNGSNSFHGLSIFCAASMFYAIATALPIVLSLSGSIFFWVASL
jgi:hypothetical protein